MELCGLALIFCGKGLVLKRPFNCMFFKSFFFNCAATDESPFPSKPALARSATRRPTKRVPPIAAAQSERFSSKEDDQDSAYEDSVERGLFDESKSEVCL